MQFSEDEKSEYDYDGFENEDIHMESDDKNGELL